MIPWIDRWLWARTRSEAVLHSMIGLAFIGLAHWLAGPQIEFSLFYVAPVFGITWRLGRRQGILMSIACAAIWGVVELFGRPVASIWIPVWNVLVGLTLLSASTFILGRIKDAVMRQTELTTDLQHALAEVRRLTGLLRICAWCRRIRNDDGQWEPLEIYVMAHAGVDFSHGICPECAAKHHPRSHMRR